MRRVWLIGLAAGGQSGIPRYAAALTRALDRVQPEFPDLSLRLLTTDRGAAQADTRNMEVKLIGRPFREANAGLSRNLAEQLHARRLDGDLLHFFDLVGPVLARRRAFVTTIHDAAAAHGFEPSRMAHKRLLQPWALKRATAAIAVSAFAKDEAVRLLDADPAKVHVIHSGPGLIGSEAVTAARGGSPSPYVLYVGNLSPHKNLPFLLEAFAAAELGTRLLLVGGRGAQFDELCRVAAASPARERIEFRRDVSDRELDNLYRDASMLVLPSRYEGFGFTALEAMSRGCPVLASDIPAMREVSGDGAWLLPPGDRDAWVAAMRRVASDGGLREELLERGRVTITRYSWEGTARRVCELFERVGRRS